LGPSSEAVVYRQAPEFDVEYETLMLPQAKITQDHQNNHNDPDDIEYVSH
jgi:hypothetical protein